MLLGVYESNIRTIRVLPQIKMEVRRPTDKDHRSHPRFKIHMKFIHVRKNSNRNLEHRKV